jgi:hypothetical protein
MKIRAGFVSNSSSSSFCMYGAEFSFSEIIEILKEIDKYPGDENPYQDENIGAWLEYEDSTVFPGLEIRHDYDCEQVYVGKKFTSIGGEETGNQFKASVESKLKECLGKEVECNTMEGIAYS